MPLAPEEELSLCVVVPAAVHCLQEESELVYKATAPVEVDDEAFEKCEALMERLLELDDVDSVHSNCEGL